MSQVSAFTDIETLVKNWLATDATLVTMLTRASDSGVSLFIAGMPLAAPVPAVVIRRIGGGPTGGDMPTELVRLSFDCWGTTRANAADITIRLQTLIHNLSEKPAHVLGTQLLYAAEGISVTWQPDKESDTARYVLDARFVAAAA